MNPIIKDTESKNSARYELRRVLKTLDEKVDELESGHESFMMGFKEFSAALREYLLADEELDAPCNSGTVSYIHRERLMVELPDLAARVTDPGKNAERLKAAIKHRYYKSDIMEGTPVDPREVQRTINLPGNIRMLEVFLHWYIDVSHHKAESPFYYAHAFLTETDAGMALNHDHTSLDKGDD